MLINIQFNSSAVRVIVWMIIGWKAKIFWIVYLVWFSGSREWSRRVSGDISKMYHQVFNWYHKKTNMCTVLSGEIWIPPVHRTPTVRQDSAYL
jgi:hypothetical protein